MKRQNPIRMDRKRVSAVRFQGMVRSRLDEIRDLAESGVSELTGRAKMESSWDERAGPGGGQGAVIGRYGGLNVPELQAAKVSPAVAARAIRRGKGKVYDRIAGATSYQLQKYGYEPAKTRAGGRPTIPGHQRLTRKCKHCLGAHTTTQHRFHGEGAFHNTHLFAFIQSRR